MFQLSETLQTVSPTLPTVLFFVACVVFIPTHSNNNHHHLHALGPTACSGSIVHRKTFLFSVRWFIIELSSNKNALQKRYQCLMEWDGDRAAVFWSTITAIICINPREGLPRPPSQMFRRWLRSITLGKGPPYLWPLEKGWSSCYKAPRHWAPCWSTDPYLVFGSPEHICWDPPSANRGTRPMGLQGPHTGSNNNNCILFNSYTVKLAYNGIPEEFVRFRRVSIQYRYCTSM
jgi:hypothetical protein